MMKKIHKILFMLLVAILIAIMLISIWQLVGYYTDEWKSNNFSDNLQKSVIIMDKEENDSMNEKNDGSNNIHSKKVSKEKNDNLITIDFDKLHEISKEAVAWLYCPNTEINYVVAQAKDNEYYLRHLLDGTVASAGTLFMDYRNNADISDWNTIIYGHHMKNGTMFASLVNYQSQSYYEKHPVMYIYTTKKCYTIEFIAGYTTKVTDMVYSIPTTKAKKDALVEQAYKQSSFNSGVKVKDDDRLVTLSTCSYNEENARYVLIGKVKQK